MYMYNCIKVRKVKVVKNKIAAPFKTAEFDIMYNEGISRTGDVLDLAANKNIVQKSGAFYKYNDQTIGQGREAAKRYLKENPAVLDEIAAKLLAVPTEELETVAEPEDDGSEVEVNGL